MDGKRLIEKIRLRNILSFGDKGEEITLEPLNIIIGQNASGKSNLIDVIKLLRSLPQEKGLANFISKNGGISEWIWKGGKVDSFAEINLKLHLFAEFYISLTNSDDGQILILDEKIIDTPRGKHVNRNYLTDNINNSLEHSTFPDLPKQLILPEQSILSIKNKVTDVVFSAFVTLYKLSYVYFFTDIHISRNSELRTPQVLSLPNDFLAEDARNLNIVLKDLEGKGKVKDKIINYLRKFNPKITDYSFNYLAEYIQLYLREEDFENPISATRLSDGTLRYLCLLAILCHPEPPPLICIEEPETGLHPDILPTIAELMIEASQRTQLIVTTHSDILVSAFSEIPEAVLVCEKDEDGTHFKRLEADKLKVWLKEYELGDLWLKGEIGGKRW
jgi:predicted ATPase